MAAIDSVVIEGRTVKVGSKAHSQLTGADTYKDAGGTKRFTSTGKEAVTDSVTSGRNSVSRLPRSREELYQELGLPVYNEGRDDQIRENSYKAMQGTIDLINQQAEEDLAVAAERQVVRDARTRGQNVNARLMGSSYASGAAAETEKIGQKERHSIRAEANAKISAALGQAEQLAVEQIQKERELNLKIGEMAIEDRNAYIAEQESKAFQSIQLFGEAGVDIEELKTKEPDVYETLLTNSGLSPFEMDAYLESYKPKESQIDYFHEQFTEGADGNAVMTRIGIDPNGKQVKRTYDLGIPFSEVGAAGQEYKTITTDNGIFALPTKIDFSKPIDEQMIRLGNKSGGSSSGGSGGGTNNVTNTSGELVPFNEWKFSDEAKQLLNAEQKRQVQANGSSSFTTSSAEKYLREVYDEGVKEYKRSSAKSGSNYTASTIPSAVKSDIIYDITNNSATLQGLIEAYPDVSSSYLKSLYDSYVDKEKKSSSGSSDSVTEMSDEEFKAWLSGEQ